jgi:hypothetical protein
MGSVGEPGRIDCGGSTYRSAFAHGNGTDVIFSGPGALPRREVGCTARLMPDETLLPPASGTLSAPRRSMEPYPMFCAPLPGPSARHIGAEWFAVHSVPQ